MKLIVTRKKFSLRWYVRIVARNGETMAHSQHYYSKENAERAAETLQREAQATSWWDIIVEDGR